MVVGSTHSRFSRRHIKSTIPKLKQTKHKHNAENIIIYTRDIRLIAIYYQNIF